MTARPPLRDLPAPGEDAARDRALEVALAAHASRRPAPSRSRRRRAAVLAGAAAGAALLVLTPTGSAVTDWVRDVVTSDPPARATGLEELPGGGRVLVVAGRRAWIAGDGTPRKLLAGAQRATWSPHGRFVAAARGAELLALDPRGDIRWALRAPAEVHALAWSPSGYRVAYAAGAQLRLVAGDGTGDRQVAARRYDPAFTGLAWKPGSKHVLAFADRRTVFVADTDRREVLWRAPAPRRSQLAFSPQGDRLLVAAEHEIRILGAATGHVHRRVDAPPGTSFAGALWDRRGERLALVRRTGARNEILVDGRRLFAAGAMRLVAFSPDNRWLLVDWTETGAWLFLPVDGGRARQLPGVAKRFDAPDARALGWCCPQ